VCYRPGQQDEFIATSASQILGQFDLWGREGRLSVNGSMLRSYASHWANALIWLAPLLKSEKYSPENEWRALVRRLPGNPLRLIGTDRCPLPQGCHPIAIVGPSKTPITDFALEIERVVVGPAAEPGDKLRVEALLESCGFAVPVEVSAHPPAGGTDN
jgi:hypothetical protein